MKTIDVCLSPELMHLYKVEDRTVVVVDIFRATSCMVTAFAHGVESITPFASLEACRVMKTKGYITSGERDGKKVDGFDKGNSPFEYMGSDVAHKKIAFTTTNGTQAIEKAKGAKRIIVGSFLNLSSVVKYLLFGENSVLVVCAGWKGKVNLEDTLFAGAVVDAAASGAKDRPRGLAALSDFVERKVPEAERSKMSEVLLRILNGSLFELHKSIQLTDAAWARDSRPNGSARGDREAPVAGTGRSLRGDPLPDPSSRSSSGGGPTPTSKVPATIRSATASPVRIGSISSLDRAFSAFS
jgi:2-phosphosulfolactate phosphatase